jgi:hypothetical protein
VRTRPAKRGGKPFHTSVKSISINFLWAAEDCKKTAFVKHPWMGWIPNDHGLQTLGAGTADPAAPSIHGPCPAHIDSPLAPPRVRAPPLKPLSTPDMTHHPAKSYLWRGGVTVLPAQITAPEPSAKPDLPPICQRKPRLW